MADIFVPDAAVERGLRASLAQGTLPQTRLWVGIDWLLIHNPREIGDDDALSIDEAVL